MGIYQDNKDAMEFFRNSKQLESNGKWQEFVEQSELEAAVQEPRNMADGGRIGLKPGGIVEPGVTHYGQGVPMKVTAERLEAFDNYIKNTDLSLKEIGEKPEFGYKQTKPGQSGQLRRSSPLVKAYERIYGEILEERFKPFKFTKESSKVKKVIELFENGMSKRTIAHKMGMDTKEIRNIFHQFAPEYIGDENHPTGEGKNAVKKRRKLIEKEMKAYWKNKPGGKEMLEKMNKKLKSIKDKNLEIIKKVDGKYVMTDQEILNNKMFREAMGLDVKGLKVGEGINFNRYANLTDADYVAKIRAMAETNRFYQPEHLISINRNNPASMLPKNIYTATGQMGGQLETLKSYVINNPKGDYVSQIDELFTSQGLPTSEHISKVLLSKKTPKKVLAELEGKLLTHLKNNPKLALEIQKQVDEGIDMTKIFNSPAVKKGMPTWIKGELAFVAIDIMNNWTKGQSFWKGLGKGIETGTFGIADFNTDERALLSKGKKLVDQGVITQQEFDSMESWIKYTAALKKRRSNQNNLLIAAQSLKENNEQADRKNILAGESAGWDTLKANVPDLEADVESAYDKEAQSAEELDQSIESYYSITDDDTMGYNTMSKVMDHLVGEEWSKTAGTVIDRGKRLNQGEGIPWSIAGHAIKDVGNLAALPWLGLKDSHMLEQAKMNLGLKETKPQERIMEHPVHGFEEAKLKHPEAWEDIYSDMDYAINPTEQLYKDGGIASLMKKK